MARVSLRMGWLVALPALLIAIAVYAASSVQHGSAADAASAVEQQQLMLTAMLDQETGARGYFQTGDRVFLEPWFKGTADFAAALARSRALAGGDAALDRALASQEQIAASWHASAAAAIEAQRHRRARPTIAEALARKELMDQFRSANASFASMLQRRSDREESIATLISVVLAAGVSLGLAAIALLLIQRAVRRDQVRRSGEHELRELLQASDSEEESRALLIRHIERVVPGAGAAVMNRNNSDDRLEPSVSARVEQTPLRELPTEALHPRSCLAVRLSRAHTRKLGEQTLAQCEVCGRLPGEIACEPLLVGGKVIGSVLVARSGPINESARASVRDAVVQAAPIIANQRNLTLAERRAASDSLTGLPNRRAADDTLKRMTAHASRTVSPLAALLIDLDHFKQVNDVHGHDAGDEALATIGAVLGGAPRASDFAARFGGEEFLVLLPDTDREHARLVAEKLRAAIEKVEFRAGRLTASFGVAVVPDDAAEPEQLLRKADRALYVAKNSGRNRVELAASGALSADQ